MNPVSIYIFAFGLMAVDLHSNAKQFLLCPKVLIMLARPKIFDDCFSLNLLRVFDRSCSEESAPQRDKRQSQ